MTQKEFMASRPDLVNNWNNIVAYRQNPNDPRWANDPNIAQLSRDYTSIDQYMQTLNGGNAFDPEPVTVNSGSPSAGFTSLVAQTPAPAPAAPVQQAPTPTGGGNYNQTQNAVQGGQFGTTGQTVQSNLGRTEQQQDQTQQGQTQQQTTGTTTTSAVDTLGLGALLKSAAPGVQATDATRTSFLTDLVQNGGSGFNDQLDAGIRKSLTGPQLTGAGDSARARIAGAAAADVGRNNLNQRLAASEQLAGPTGLTSLVNAGTPYVGKSESSTGNSLTSQLNNITGKTTGLSDLLQRTSEATSGTTSAQSSQAGSGQIPQGQPVQTGGGCVLCTAAIELKLSKHHRVLRRVIRHKLITDSKRFRSAAKGYFAVFTPLAAWLLSHPRLARVLWPLAKAVVYEELRVSGRHLPLKVWPWSIHWIGHTFCAVVGDTLPVKGYVDNPRILDIARKNNILFEVQS